jgi:hypothetical protein
MWIDPMERDDAGGVNCTFHLSSVPMAPNAALSAVRRLLDGAREAIDFRCSRRRLRRKDDGSGRRRGDPVLPLTDGAASRSSEVGGRRRGDLRLGWRRGEKRRGGEKKHERNAWLWVMM